MWALAADLLGGEDPMIGGGSMWLDGGLAFFWLLLAFCENQVTRYPGTQVPSSSSQKQHHVWALSAANRRGVSDCWADVLHLFGRWAPRGHLVGT